MTGSDQKTPPTRATWKTNNTFRRWVALTLKLAGLPNIGVRPAHRTTPGVYATDSAITGIPNWAFAVSTEATRDLSGTLDRARDAALADGSQRYAAIFHRPGREPEESYVLLDFQTLTHILKGESRP
jgi:hypothetical protein